MNQKGFTLIGITFSIAIVVLLSSLVAAIFKDLRPKARDLTRKNDLVRIEAALGLYFEDNKSYPSTGGSWWGVTGNGQNKTTSGPNAYVPGLTPDYIDVLPLDPLDNRGGWSGYLYRSDGKNYKLLSHNVGPESFPSAGQPFYDPFRPTWALMVCSAAPACSSW